MGNQSTFENILNQEFRWPQPGDDPFAIPKGIADATIVEDKFLRFVLMMEGYKRAAETLVGRCLENRRETDFLIFPIMFLYRHCLELQLKYIINTYGPQVGVAPTWNTHDLAKLWHEFKAVLDSFGTGNLGDTDSIVEKTVAQFAKIDPKSFSHRYPCDIEGKPIPLIQSKLDLETLKDVMEGVFGYFSGCDGYLDALVSAWP